jgi:SAM-dependent methyltransferase
MRTPEQVLKHYEIEKELADRLRGANRDERAPLYGLVYDELFRRVPDHPQLTRKVDEQARLAASEDRMALLGRFLNADTVFLEIGAGDGALTRLAAPRVKKCYALDVSKEILSNVATAANMEKVLSDGCSVPVPAGSVNVAYSYQVMEHIHPDDAQEQLRNIFRALAPGGMYLCVTPNRLNGPHDVSRAFDRVARGFHLKEYTVTELRDLFKAVGFRRVQPYTGLARRYFPVPLSFLVALEFVLGRLPFGLQRWLGSLRGFQNLLFIGIAAVK